MNAGHIRRRAAGWLLAAAGSLLAACAPQPELQPFTSDGCSLFPDSGLISGDDWCACCFEHDRAYWRGGTAQAREAADDRLRACVLDVTGDEALSNLVYEGVRLGGSPYFYTWYRWGYGWGFERKYQALTDEEKIRADELEADYFRSNPEPVCDG